MPVVRTVNRSHRPDIAVAAGWPLARRLGLTGLAAGGPRMSDRLVRGVDVRTGDRVVDLLPGDGSLGRLATRHNLHSWTGVCLDRGAARGVRARVQAPCAGTILGSPDRTGLDAGSVTVVMADGLLTGLSWASKRAVLEEARRILRPGGRLGFQEIAITAPEWNEEPADAVAAEFRGYRDGALHPLTDEAWRALLTDAGLEIVGTSTAPLEIPSFAELVSRRGMGTGVRVALGMLVPGGPGRRMRRAVEQLTRHRARLTATVIVAERPLVGPLRPIATPSATAASGDD